MDNKTLTITRVFNAPRERVWRAWTDAEELQKWWGPRGVTNPVCEWDLQPGGAINIVMLAGPELGPLAGQEWPMEGKTLEVSAPERLVFEGGAIVNGKTVMKHICTVTLEEEGDKTRMTLHIEVTETTPEAEGPLSGMEMGWNQSIDKLGELVAQ